ncbi:unnamed protein product [Gadus morhua 'NCC']
MCRWALGPWHRKSSEPAVLPLPVGSQVAGDRRRPRGQETGDDPGSRRQGTTQGAGDRRRPREQETGDDPVLAALCVCQCGAAVTGLTPKQTLRPLTPLASPGLTQNRPANHEAEGAWPRCAVINCYANQPAAGGQSFTSRPVGQRLLWRSQQKTTGLRGRLEPGMD